MATVMPTSPITNENAPAILEAAAVKRRRESISLATVATIIIGVIVVSFATRGVRLQLPVSAWVALIGAVLFHIVFSAWNARCPSCNDHLGGLIRTASFCPHCGVRLKSEGEHAV